MTVVYTHEVAQSNTWNFFKLLFRWRGSLWKVLWPELSLWLVLYTLLSVIYRLLLNEKQQLTFENIVKFWSAYAGNEFVPLTFILGFFVSLVISRWWDMYLSIGSTEKTAVHIACYIEGDDEETVTLRRNIIRYMVVVQTMVLSKVSASVRKRFPNLEAFKTAGLINDSEQQVINDFESVHPKHWLPIYWAMALIKKAHKDGQIPSESYMLDLYTKLSEFRAGLGKLSSYIAVPIPLAYTQVVFLAVRLYFVIALFAEQYLIQSSIGDNAEDGKIRKQPELSFKFAIDLYFPFATVIKFFFYVGWVKVAESLFNPFGTDDDDFDVNAIITKNLQMGLAIVDNGVGKIPEQSRDLYAKTGNDAPFHHDKEHYMFPVQFTDIRDGVQRMAQRVPLIGEHVTTVA
uniref:Bestrophin homolog n=1 Tax=Plectus sambesii TaxID=2011161 RepID=A0A914X757_9BILA